MFAGPGTREGKEALHQKEKDLWRLEGPKGISSEWKWCGPCACFLALSWLSWYINQAMTFTKGSPFCHRTMFLACSSYQLVNVSFSAYPVCGVSST